MRMRRVIGDGEVVVAVMVDMEVSVWKCGGDGEVDVR